MRHSRYTLGLLAILIFGGGCDADRIQAVDPSEVDESCGSQLLFPPARPEEVGLSSAVLHTAVDSVKQWVENDEVVGAILLLIRHNRTVLYEAIGWNDREDGVPLDVDDIVRFRSMTKPVTGTAILTLVDAGMVRIQDRVADYIPAFDSEEWDDVTIHQVMTHTSGITGGLNARSGLYADLREAVDALAQRGPGYPPGTATQYADGNSSVLGVIIEVVTGMPPDEYKRREILESLAMDDAFIYDLPPGDPRRQRVASTYRIDNGLPHKYWVNTDPLDVGMPFYGGGAAGLYGTAMDYARFLATWLYGGELEGVRILKSETVDLALEPQSAYVYPEEERDSRDDFRGLHWVVHSDRWTPYTGTRSAGFFGHGGIDGTYGWADREYDMIGLVLTQTRGTTVRGRFMDLVYKSIMVP